MLYQSIYQYITSEEENFKTNKIEVAGGYFWNFYTHILTTALYKLSQFLKGTGDENRPFKNIIRPILNLQYQTEGFDIKDIELYVDDAKHYAKSFLVRKFHEKWAREMKIDSFIDDLVESYVDFGGALVKKLKGGYLEVVPMQRLAFCDQTDILSGTICEKHYFSPSELISVAKNSGWEMDKAKFLAQVCELQKKENYATTESATPSPYIEVYELHGNLPASWLSEDGNLDEYVPQMQVCAFYKSGEKGANGEYSQNGITLFKTSEPKPRYKFISRHPVYGRALGIGGAEELFQDQIWANYAEITKKNLLDAAGKVLYQTADESFHTRNKTHNLSNGEILVHEPGSPISQVNTFPNSLTLFDRLSEEWLEHARFLASAEGPVTGSEAKSGTPFKLQSLITNRGLSIHEYRKGKIATFLDEVYKDWVIPYLVAEILKGQEFFAKLDVEEMQDISDRMSKNYTDKMITEKILNGNILNPDEIEAYRTLVKSEFQSSNKKFIKILKDEFRDTPIDIKINIAGKQRYLAEYVEKLGNIFQIIAANPAVLNDQRLTRILNQMLEAANMEPISLAEAQPVEGQAPASAVQPQPLTQYRVNV